MRNRSILPAWTLWLIWVLALVSAPASAGEQTLNVYGPGGPLSPMQECADLFSSARGVRVLVTAGPETNWIERAKQDADLVFGGAEYMLSQFQMKYPELLDEKTRTSLYVRPAGILVRKGNPKNIKSLDDLSREGIKIIDVAGAGQLGLWEDLAGAKGLIPGIQKNIFLTVGNSAQAIEKWKTVPEIDAWINFESWYLRLPEITDLVTLAEKDKLYRGTPIAATRLSKNRSLALEFIEFLKSAPAHKVFQKWGWK